MNNMARSASPSLGGLHHHPHMSGGGMGGGGGGGGGGLTIPVTSGASELPPGILEAVTHMMFNGPGSNNQTKKKRKASSNKRQQQQHAQHDQHHQYMDPYGHGGMPRNLSRQELDIIEEAGLAAAEAVREATEGLYTDRHDYYYR